MITHKQLPELRVFKRTEGSLPIEVSTSWGELVVANGNDSIPIHRWFRYKEAFSSDILSAALDRLNINIGKTFNLLDPFCGVGTTLVSAQSLFKEGYKISATGIECNPFSAFVSRSKVEWQNIDPFRLNYIASEALDSPLDSSLTLPSLSSIKTGRCISKYMARRVLSVGKFLKSLPDSAERNALLVGLSAAIEPVSKVRKDGRALRIVNKSRVNFLRILKEKWDLIEEDVTLLSESIAHAPSPTVKVGDGRDPLSVGITKGSIDLILTSPPYPNNIDYNEVYKLELWLMGFINDSDSFLGLRRKTFRSHPSCSKLDINECERKRFSELITKSIVADILKPLIKKIAMAKTTYPSIRKKVLLGYVYDTFRSLKSHYLTLKEGGYAVYVVGNSLHGGPDTPYLIPTDLLLSLIAQETGFHVDRIIFARPLSRRLAGNHFLRDSVIVLRKIK